MIEVTNVGWKPVLLTAYFALDIVTQPLTIWHRGCSSRSACHDFGREEVCGRRRRSFSLSLG